MKKIGWKAALISAAIILGALLLWGALSLKKPNPKTPQDALTLGLKYAHGDGLAADKGKAFNLIQQAANKGFAPAEYNLGTLYYNGDGVAVDKNNSSYWLKQSADHGSEAVKNQLKIWFSS